MPATLRGWTVGRAPDGAHPLIAEAQGQAADGLFVVADTETRARVDWYEAAFGYEARAVTVETAEGPREAIVYASDAADPPSGLWELAGWRSSEGALALEAAREVMGLRGAIDAATLRRRFPTIRARAWSRRLGARTRPDTLGGRPRPSALDLTARVARHVGFYRLDELTLRHGTFAGGPPREIVREAFVGFDAALVVPYDPADDRIVLIEQLRAGAVVRDDPGPWLMEPVAGLIDPGETPEETARREALEETGLTLGRLDPVARGYASPGGASDFFHCFVGICDLAGRTIWTGGKPEEGEDIRAHALPLDRALAAIGTGEINVVPLTMILLWIALSRDRLRGSA